MEFTDNEKKDELILGLINKFVFIQILSDFGIIPFNRIRTLWYRYWDDYSDRYKIFLTELMDQVNTWFFTYYDTNLFQIQEIKELVESDANYKLFTEKLKKVLGFEEYNILRSNALRDVEKRKRKTKTRVWIHWFFKTEALRTDTHGNEIFTT